MVRYSTTTRVLFVAGALIFLSCAFVTTVALLFDTGPRFSAIAAGAMALGFGLLGWSLERAEREGSANAPSPVAKD